MEDQGTFGMGFYFRTLTRMLGEPRRFFGNLPEDASAVPPLGFLVLSSFFCAVAGVVASMSPRPFLAGTVFFVNGVGMALLLAALGYMVMTMSPGRKTGFGRLLSVYAFASGTVLLASWVPFFVWLTEPWKWWLIGTGMVQCCGLKRGQALWIVGASLVLTVLLFYSVAPVLVCLLRPWVRSF